MKVVKFLCKPWLFPLLLLLLFAPFSARYDLAIERYFYNSGSGIIHFSENPFFAAVYDYGFLPADIVAAVAALLLPFSYLSASLRWLRPHLLMLTLTLIVGAGLITHAILKDHWGRPRPKQVELFGGQNPFYPFYKPNFSAQNEPMKSFPCGHCTTGFYFFTLYFIGRRVKSPSLAVSGLVLALLGGGVLGVTRMAQGGHFLSDVLVSAVVMWLTALLFDWMIYEELYPPAQTVSQ